VRSVEVTPANVTLDAIGNTQQFSAVARDASGASVVGKSFTWASSDIAVASVSSGGLAMALKNGTATINATADGVSGSVSLSVAQSVTSVETLPGIFSADEFTTQTFEILFTDANDAPVPNVVFLVSADSGVGSVSPDSGVTDDDGKASVAWTLGGNQETETGTEAITIMSATGNVSHTSIVRAQPFTPIQCLDFEHSGFWMSAGGCQYNPRAPGSSFDVSLRVTQSDYTPIAGATVSFTIDPTCLGSCDNAGSVSVASAVTDANGLVTLRWTLGPNSDSNRMVVGVPGRSVGIWVRGQ